MIRSGLIGTLVAIALACVATGVAAPTAAAWELDDGGGEPFSGEFGGFQESGVFVGDFDISCSESELAGSVDTPGSLDGTMALHLRDCTFGGLVPCSMDFTDETMDFHISPTNEVEGELALEADTTFVVDCAFFSCTFAPEDDLVEGHITEGAPVEIAFTQQHFQVQGGPCGDWVWTAHWLIDDPSAGLFIEHSPPR